jgi:hypothetical protein
MLRKASRIVGGIVGFVIVAASASSCVVNHGSILIIGILAPPTSTSSGGSASCTYTATATGPFQSTGFMDIAFEQEYQPVLLLGNQLVAQGNASLDRVETNNVNIEGATVRVTDSAGAVLDNFTVLGAGFLFPSQASTPGLASYGTTLVSPKAVAALGTFTGTKRIVSYIKVYGTTSGGTHIESAEEPFSVNVCIGCLVNFPLAADDPTSPKQPNCNASASSSTTSNIAIPCVLGQDQPIDCRLCSLTYAACQP